MVVLRIKENIRRGLEYKLRYGEDKMSRNVIRSTLGGMRFISIIISFKQKISLLKAVKQEMMNLGR